MDFNLKTTPKAGNSSQEFFKNLTDPSSSKQENLLSKKEPNKDKKADPSFGNFFN